jgi:uncharacterized protein (DUF1778 family)
MSFDDIREFSVVYCLMPAKKSAAAKKPRLVDVRIRFTEENRDAIAAAAAKRGLGFNTFVRLVAAGTAKLVLAQGPVEDLVAPYLDAEHAKIPLRPSRQKQLSQTAAAD